MPRITPVSARFGWGEAGERGPELARDAYQLIGDQFPRFYIAQQQRGSQNTRVCLWDAAKLVNNGQHLPTFTQEIGDCFIDGTMVKMADGSEKPIEDVIVGDMVLSYMGVPRKVLRIIAKPYSGELITLNTSAPRNITCTPDHRLVRPIIYHDRKPTDFTWIAAEQIGVGDNLLLPYSECEIDNQPLDLAYLVSGQQLIRHYKLPLLTQHTVRRKGCLEPINRHIAVDERLARLIGIYLAEGGVSRTVKKSPHRVDFSLGSHETLLAAEIVELFRNIFGTTAVARSLPSKPSVLIVHCGNSNVAKFFADLMPGNLWSKRIPKQFYCATRGVKLALIRGWMDGDGNEKYRESTRDRGGGFKAVGVSSSSGLRSDFYQLALSCRLRPCHNPRPARNKSFNTKPSGSVALHGESALAVYPEYRGVIEAISIRPPHKSMTKMTRLGLSLPVKRKISTVVENITVRCLEVETDNSFVANGYAVHNCVSMGATNAVDYLYCCDIIQRKVREQYRPSFQPYIYGTSRVQIGNGRIRGDGSLGIWAAQAVVKYGTLFADYTGVPPYSGSVAKSWGSSGPPQQFLDYAKDFTIKTTAKVNSYTECRDAIANWYPVTVASNRGFKMTLVVDKGKAWGVPSGVWGHQMVFIAVDDDPARPGCYCMNSWGAQAFMQSPDGAPPGGFWVDAEVVDQMVKADGGDSWAYSNLTGYPARDLDFMLI